MPPQTLTLGQLNRATLARQGLLEPIATRPLAAVVERLGSLQAQHPDWPPVALSARLSARVGRKDLDAARRRREVVRAQLMRVTVHIVSAGDYWPMSALTVGYRLDQFRAMYKLDPVHSPLARRLRRAQPAVLAALDERPLTIAEIESLLRREIGRIEIPPNRALWRHFSGSVPLVLVPYQGEAYGRARYQAAAGWLGSPPDGSVGPEAAAERLAERYLSAFGPASPADLAAYVGRGRSPGRMRDALQRIGDRLVRLRGPDGRELVDLVDAPRPAASTPAPPRLLARWDSLLLAYGTRDRSRVLAPEHQAAVITRNADVLPTILVDGMVAGTWLPRRRDGAAADVELQPFGRLRTADRRALEAEAERLLPALADGAFARYPGSD